jgi:hypothetical protein
VRALEILAKLESVGIEPTQARAILECLELAAAESKQNAPVSAFPSAIHHQSSATGFVANDLRTEMSLCASDLRSALIELKADLIKWMFFFAVTQSLAFALILKLHIS